MQIATGAPRLHYAGMAQTGDAGAASPSRPLTATPPPCHCTPLAHPPRPTHRPAPADYKEQHTDVSVKFVVKLAPEKLAEAMAAGLHAKFKLTTKISIGGWVGGCRGSGGWKRAGSAAGGGA